MVPSIILDCDPGHDDAIALMLALGSSDKLSIKAVSTVGGNQTLEKVTLNTLKLLTLMQRTDIPVFKGNEKPLTRPLESAASIHGVSGLDGPDLAAEQINVTSGNLVELYANVLRESKDKITFVVTGPQTNMAIFLLAYPELKPKIDKIIFMGGACFGGNWSPKAEFNIYVDPEAAKVVANSGVPLVMCGLDVTHKSTITFEEVERFRNIGNKTGKVFAELIDFFSSTSGKDFLAEQEGIKIRLHDVAAVSYLLSPELFTTRDLFVDIDVSDSNYTRGATIVDYDGIYHKKPNMTVCFDIDRKAFIEQLFSAIEKLP